MGWLVRLTQWVLLALAGVLVVVLSREPQPAPITWTIEAQAALAPGYREEQQTFIGYRGENAPWGMGFEEEAFEGELQGEHVELQQQAVGYWLVKQDGGRAGRSRTDLGLYSLVEETPEMRALRRYLARRYEASEQDLRTWFKTIDVEAKRFGLDPLLIVAVIAVESEFDPMAVSSHGALGLMQVVPRWHLALIDERVPGEPEEEHLFDPSINISVGAEVLARALKRHKNLERALQAYNGSADKRYARKVLSIYKRLTGLVQRSVEQAGMGAGSVRRSG